MKKPSHSSILRYKLGASALLMALSLPVLAEDLFPQSVYVTMRESNQVAKFAGPTIWQGAPKSLYDSLSPDGKTLVVTSPKDGAVYFFDTGNGKKLGMVKTGKEAKGVKISPNGKLVFVSNEGGNSVSIVDMAKRKLLKTIKTPAMPHNVRVTNDGNTVFVTLQGGAGLGVIDVKSGKLVKIIKTPGIDTPHNLDLSLDEKYAFIRDTANHVGVLDIGAENIVKILDVGQGHAGIDVIPNGKLVFTGAIADDVVSVIDAEKMEVIKKIKVGFGPHGVRASKDNRYLYVSVTADDLLVVIDINTLEVVSSTKLASFPFWVAVNGNP